MPTDRPIEQERRRRPAAEALLRLIEARTTAATLLRRGVIGLNVGRFEEAESAFSQALELDPGDRSLPSLLAAACLAIGQPERAVSALLIATSTDHSDTASRIRHALVLNEAGQRDEGIRSLREGIRCNPECAELHFQLGTMLAAVEDYDEAELRFTQAVNIQSDHSEALLGLALCHGARENPTEALRYLQMLQARHPRDARIGLLLTQAAKAVHQQGLAPKVRACLFRDDPVADEKGIEELSRVIEADPEFVDAFLSIPAGALDAQIYTVLFRTMEKALERQPEHAELRFHCGQVLERLGRRNDAIAQEELAVELNPSHVRALIELAKLYRQTDRRADALSRLEQAVEVGAEYADVYCLMGDLHRDAGEWNRARDAYHRALTLNALYRRAQDALETLPA